ncbi:MULTISPECIES: cytochrome c-type biogenesis protein [unclassified Halomonas]|uniref:cytochrome c-type biogenesis protein n=1 Tax=unclassified Halomonas TaxID=2609666 RepID=UPI0020A1E09D|nr:MULTISPECIES: cytochrome c-type biogenesis protein [unclassified Halomonas]MCP1315070.1 cytochrome c-type biogenesis protein CcmH [Halomonas sp. 707D7]MCP1327889.1 cytochrome c-type biogenesis protein CcmH [Halomonas sp. 707D4]
MALMRLLALLAGLLVSVASLAAIEVRSFDDPVLERRYADLTASMRCPLCENQAIDDSNAPIAADMRQRVFELLQEGQSDSEIVNHMVTRFGEYILYNPRLENRTYLLWGVPIALVVLATFVVILLVRARRHASSQALSDQERERLAALLNRKRSS